MHSDRRTRDPSRFPEEGRLAHVGFDQIERDSGRERQNQAWKPGAGAQIDSPVGRWAHQRRKLERIGEVALPECRLIAGSDQIDRSVPAEEERRELLKRL